MNTQIDNILSNSKTVALIGHINPDGDCFGSLSAVNDYILTKFGSLVHCFAECDTIAEEFQPFAKDIVFNPIALTHYDCCICVDTGDLGRLGKYLEVFNNSTTTICIDHHATNKGFAQINEINLRSSNCENIYHMLKQANFNISKTTAGKLFAGIVTDTNNLSTNTVTKDTYNAVIDLIDKGINYYKIIKFFMGGNSMVQFKLLSIAMNGAKFYNNDTIMVMEITPEQLMATGGTQEDLNPIINQAFCMKHAKSAVLITPRNGQTHVSFRGRGDIDVSHLAQHFGGGGHKAAAAFTIPTFTDEDLNYIIKDLTNEINLLPQENENLF
ncbi:MAG: DHH family phosphoesterase [Clostridia bacterium]|nr:DHH family phosphoesterase [Clostridia bacterium]